MEYDILHKPSYALARVKLNQREQLQAETGAMVSMSDSIKMDTSTRGGIFGGLRRSVLGGESFFVNTFTAEQAGEVTIAPALPGDIEALELQGETLLVQSGSFLAATMNIEVDSQWGGARSFFSKEGLFLLRCSGRGLLFVSSYGAIHRIDLGRGERYTVDNGHMVAFDDSVRYEVGRSGGWKTTLLGGEGLVCKLEGPGRFYMQTRSEDAFLSWLAPKVGNK
jgi:uncharacterized protein (TIGR00266 family)